MTTTQPDGADTLAQLRQRIAEAVDGVFEQWIDGLDGQRPQDAITAAVLAVVQPEMERLRKAERAVNLLADSHRRAEEAELSRELDELRRAHSGEAR